METAFRASRPLLEALPPRQRSRVGTRILLQPMKDSRVAVPTFQPRIGVRPGEVGFQHAPRFCRSVLVRAQVRFARAASLGRPRPPRKNGTRCVADVPRPGADSRRCIVKARVIRMNGGRDMQATRLHLAYIERDGVEQDGS
jgi:hypothetical protein